MSYLLPARAKINRHLRVGVLRRDGYHSLETLFQEISLHDTLRFEISGGPLELIVTPARGLSAGPDNLVLRALALLRQKLRVKQGMRVLLDKRIPIGAGLGGGSSDAAAALWGGWIAWKKRPVSEALQRRKIPPVLLACAKQLGADVPFFLKGGTAWAEGIGEKLTPLAGFPKATLVVVYPNVHVSTAKAYRWLDAAPREKDLDTIYPVNSFERVVLPRYPQIAAAHRALREAGCEDVMLSGSGSAVFGFVKNEVVGQRIAAAMRRRGWKTFVARTVHGSR